MLLVQAERVYNYLSMVLEQIEKELHYKHNYYNKVLVMLQQEDNKTSVTDLVSLKHRQD